MQSWGHQLKDTEISGSRAHSRRGCPQPPLYSVYDHFASWVASGLLPGPALQSLSHLAGLARPSHLSLGSTALPEHSGKILTDTAIHSFIQLTVFPQLNSDSSSPHLISLPQRKLECSGGRVEGDLSKNSWWHEDHEEWTHYLLIHPFVVSFIHSTGIKGALSGRGTVQGTGCEGGGRDRAGVTCSPNRPQGFQVRL